MASLLHRLGLWCTTHAGRVVAIWLVLLVGVGVAAATAGGETEDDFSIPGTESFEALDRLGEAFPGADGTSAQVVFAAPPGERLDGPRYAAAINETVRTLAEGPQVLATVDPFSQQTVSPDGRIGYATVQYDVPVEQISVATREVAAEAVASAREAGLAAELGGEALLEPIESGHVTEIVGLGVAALVLVITLGSLVAAGLPLLTAVLGVGIGLAGVGALSAVFDMSSTAPTLALMLGLAVGIDYALFIIIRHRAQVADGMATDESIARANGTAGSAVVFAGVTVVIALAGLSLVGIPFLTVMGLAAAGTVVIAVLIAVTLLPAVLGLLGRRLEGGRVRPEPPAAGAPKARSAMGARWVRIVARRPLLTVAACLLGLGMLAVPLASLQLGLPGAESASQDRTERRAYDLIAEGFGPGSNGTLVLLVEQPGAAAAAAQGLIPSLAELPGVLAVAPPELSQSGDAAVLAVVPTTGPADDATNDLVGDIRDLAGDVEETSGARVSVTGTTAINIDISDRLAEALPVFLAVVVGLALVLLTAVFRSVLVPLQAAVGFLLSLAATAGAVVAVFQWGWLGGILGVDQVGPILNFLPVLLIGILFGLAMDYHVFLVSRMREEHSHGAGPQRAVEVGFAQGARVVTAAALIMIAVFLGFFFADDPIVKAIGFALAFGVAVDAFVVRMTLIPAVMVLTGQRNWMLPGWLERRLPHLDVEGTALAELTPVDQEAPRDDKPIPARS